MAANTTIKKKNDHFMQLFDKHKMQSNFKNEMLESKVNQCEEGFKNIMGEVQL